MHSKGGDMLKKTVCLGLAVASVSAMMTTGAFAAVKLAKCDSFGESISATKFQLDWDSVSKAKGYKVYKKTNGKYKLYKTLSKSKDSLVLTRKLENTYYRVRAYNGSTLSKYNTVKVPKRIKRTGTVYDYVVSKAKSPTVKSVNIDGFQFKDKGSNCAKMEFYLASAYPLRLPHYNVNYEYFPNNDYELCGVNLTTSKAYFDRAEKAKAVLDKVKVTGSNYEKAKKLHDWVLDNTTYGDPSKMVQHEAYSVAIDHTSICEGYALCYQYLCQINGVESRLVYADDMTHAWNAVQLDGHWYVVDCTWDDDWYETFEKYGLGNKYRYRHFLVSDESHGMTSRFVKCPTDHAVTVGRPTQDDDRDDGIKALKEVVEHTTSLD